MNMWKVCFFLLLNDQISLRFCFCASATSGCVCFSVTGVYVDIDKSLIYSRAMLCSTALEAWMHWRLFFIFLSLMSVVMLHPSGPKKKKKGFSAGFSLSGHLTCCTNAGNPPELILPYVPSSLCGPAKDKQPLWLLKPFQSSPIFPGGGVFGIYLFQIYCDACDPCLLHMPFLMTLVTGAQHFYWFLLI